MTDKVFLIGNPDDWGVYQANLNNVDALPLRNLPVSYFPFYYNEIESSVEKMKKLVPLLENYTKVNGKDKEDAATYDINIDQLFSLLTTLEEPYQPFNSNNVKHIRNVVVISWAIIIFLILKLLHYFIGDKYTYFILFMIVLFLIIATIWALVVTSKSF